MSTGYVTVCPTCGTLPGRWKFVDDATGLGLRHQQAKTNRVFVDSPLDPAHACTVEIAK